MDRVIIETGNYMINDSNSFPFRGQTDEFPC